MGVFKKDKTSTDQQPRLKKLNTTSGSMNVSCKNINADDLVYSVIIGETTIDTINYNNWMSHNHPLQITRGSTVTDTDFVGETVGHPSGDTDGLRSTVFNLSSGHHGIAIVYASKGLNDLSAANECGLTFGLEVSQNAQAGDQKIYVTSSSNSLINEGGQAVIYFNGAIPEATNTVTGAGATTITSAVGANDNNGPTSSNDPYIEISNALATAINAGTTLVGVGHAYSGIGGKFKNREYCIIPLNTAPPFASTAFGLATSVGYPSLLAKEIAFKQLSLTYGSGIAGANILSLVDSAVGNTSGNADAYAPINHNGTEYKMLIKNDITHNP